MKNPYTSKMSIFQLYYWIHWVHKQTCTTAIIGRILLKTPCKYLMNCGYELQDRNTTQTRADFSHYVTISRNKLFLGEITLFDL